MQKQIAAVCKKKKKKLTPPSSICNQSKLVSAGSGVVWMVDDDVQTKDDLLRDLAEEIRRKDGDLEAVTEKLEVRSNELRAIVSGEI